MQLQLNQPLYTAGRLSNAYGIQASGLDASRLSLERSRQELQYQVVETFYAALMNEQGVRVAEEQIALNTKQLALAKARFEAGSVARLDVLQAEVELANSKARRIQAQGGRRHLTPGAAHRAVAAAIAAARAQRHARRASADRPTRTVLEAALPSRPDLRAFNARKDRPSTPWLSPTRRWKPSLSLTGNMQYQDDGVKQAAERRQPELHVRLRAPRAALRHARRRRAARWWRRRK